MPDFLPQLQKLIACKVDVDNHQVILKESGTESSYSIKITDLPDNVFVFKADAFPQPQALFNDLEQGVRKRADYILLADDSKKRRVVFIEMKHHKDSERKIIAQLCGAACIMDYCNAVLKRFWGKSACVTGFDERFVSCCHVSSKKATRPDRNAPVPDSPNQLLKLKGCTITYRQLIKQ